MTIRDLIEDLAAFVTEGKKHTTPQLKRCVAAVAKDNGGDISKAFAICTASLQKKGFLKPGTNAPTKKGATAGRRKAAEKGHTAKVAEYETMLKASHK
jgi:hypothetical protein